MSRRPLGYVACLLVLLCAESPAFASRIALPDRHSVYSPNEKFVADVEPEEKTVTVYAANDRSRPLWVFKWEIWVKQVMLANDGNSAALLGRPIVFGHFVYGGRTLTAVKC